MTTEITLNSYTEQIISEIDLYTNYRCAVITEAETISTCQTNLIEYLRFYVETVKTSDKSDNDYELILATKLDELLGIDVVGKYCDLMKEEARYYIRLFWLNDRLMFSLIKILHLYNSQSVTDTYKALNSFMSLLMLNSYLYKAGAATQKPLFGLGAHSDTNQRNVETCIQFLIRNISEFNLHSIEVPSDYTIIEAMLLTTLNMPLPVPTSDSDAVAENPKDSEAVVTKAEEPVGLITEKGITANWMFLSAYLIVFIAIGALLFTKAGGDFIRK